LGRSSSAYPEANDSLKAEEVFAFACEAIEPQMRGNVIEGTRSFRETCIERRARCRSAT
jgi:putative DNA primase/helicase